MLTTEPTVYFSNTLLLLLLQLLSLSANKWDLMSKNEIKNSKYLLCALIQFKISTSFDSITWVKLVTLLSLIQFIDSHWNFSGPSFGMGHPCCLEVFLSWILGWAPVLGVRTLLTSRWRWLVPWGLPWRFPCLTFSVSPSIVELGLIAQCSLSWYPCWVGIWLWTLLLADHISLPALLV